MKVYLIIILSIIFAGGCANAPKTETADYDITTQARVRAIKGAGIFFYPGKECSAPTLLNVGNEGYSATGGLMAAFERNKSIGMPLLPDTPQSFNEHFVQANIPLTIEALSSQQVGNMLYMCGPVIGTFKPSPGKDYEVMLEQAGSSCALKIREIAFTGVEAKPIPVHFEPSSRCKGFPW